MKQVKSFIIHGETVTRNGIRERKLADQVDVKLNGILANLDGELVDVKITPEFGGASGDNAFVTVVFESNKAVKKSKESK